MNVRTKFEVCSFTRPRSLFSEVFNGLLFQVILTQNLKFVVLPVPEIIGGTENCFW